MIGTALGLGLGALGAGGSILGGLIGKGGSDAAAGAYGQAGQNADYIRHRNEANLSSWFQTGQGASGLIGQLLGLGSLVPDGQGYGGLRLDDTNWKGAQQNAFQRFQTDPGYQFRFDEGQRALDRSAASKGMLLSGAQNKASQAFGGNLASGEYNNWFNKLAGVSGQGLTAAQGENSSNLAATGLQNQALQGQASAYQSGANALANGINSGINSLGSIYGMTNGFGGFGGFGGGTGLPGSGTQF